METRFAHLYKRESSVSMIRVKMSRRRSQTHKENRERMQNLRRRLDQLPESELSMDLSTLEKSVIPAQETGHKTKAGNSAAEERKNMLARFKEQKALQKEKERREKEKKGVFKFGLYRPQPLGYLPSNPVVLTTAKTAVSVQSTRVTRSMKQQPQLKQLTERQAALNKVEPAVKAPATRSSSRTVAAAATAKAVVKPTAGVKTRSASRQHFAPSTDRGKTTQGNKETMPAVKQPAKEEVPAVTPSLPEEAKMVEKAKLTGTSFAPQGFVFQPPVGLRTFQSRPLSPQSAEAFLSPSFSFEPKTELTVATPLPHAPPPAPPSPPPSCVSSAPPASTSRVASAPSPASPSPPFSPPEPQHDVSYFRAVMASETERLTGLSELWETRFDDSSVPEEMRDQMRTAVGQARLLMKERFGQFRGLVDDCDLGRGEKITTCSDLQGFWDMVYFQVEDVNKKFNALKEAESRGWHEETKTVTKQKKVLKKPPVAGSKPGAGGGASAAAKSRLAAVKAAMKARQAAVEQASGAAGVLQGELAPDAAANTAAAQTVMFHGGFFQVESPAKVVGAVRRSSRLSAAPLPQPSPRVSKFGTPGRLHRSTVISRASPLPHVTIATPAKVAPPTATPDRTSRSPPESFPCSPKPPPISPTCHALAPVASPRVSHAEHDTPDSDFATAPADAPVSQSPEIQAHSCPHQPEATLPLHLPEQLCTVPEEATPESDALTESSHEQAEEPVVPELVAVHPATDASPVRSGSPGLSRSPPVSTTFPPQVEILDRQASAPSSPCMMSSTPQVLSPAPSDNAALPNGERSRISANLDMTESPHVECVADLDFERYLQPAALCSLSAVQSPAVERFSLGAGDVEMESPLSQAEESGQEVQMTPTALPRMAPLVFTPGTEQLTDNLLLFTPEQRNRVKQSGCDGDLMMFTPPSSK